MTLALALLWHGAVASAATVAVLVFDGYGVAFSDAQTAAQGVRDAFLEEGALDPLSGSDIADGVSKGQDDALRAARELVSEGRRLFTAGDASGALAPLLEAIRLHDTAFSDVGRRSELADATFLLGLCLQKAGQSDEARARFAEAAALVPAYAKERGTRMSSDAAALLASAEETVAKGPRRARPWDEVGRIGEALGVDYVVTGWVAADGGVSTRMYADGGQLVAEVTATLEETPPLPVDAAYNDVARRLAEAGAGPMAAAVPPVETPEELPDPEADPGPLPDLDEEDVEAAVATRPTRAARPSPRTTSSPRATPPPRTSSSPRTTVTRETKPRVSDAGGMRYAEAPITQRWWFWAGAVGIASGGAFGIWYALLDPPVEYVEEPDAWTLTVTVPPPAE
ncbi:MAG: hypothetical protein Q8P18_26645 [Pseudomonadota bacterium]|nr:hypothetical protein [Pseudomonadota bacterium]